MNETPTRGTFRAKHPQFEAIQWTGLNTEEVKAFAGMRDNGECRFLLREEIFGTTRGDAILFDEAHNLWLRMDTYDWVARDASGEIVAIEDRVFSFAYEPMPGDDVDV